MDAFFIWMGMALEQKHIEAAFWEAETRKKSGKYNVDEEGFDRAAMAEHFRMSERTIQMWRNDYREYKPLVRNILRVMGVKVSPQTKLEELWTDAERQAKEGNAQILKMLIEYHTDKVRKEQGGSEDVDLQAVSGIELRKRMIESAHTLVSNLIKDSQLEYKEKVDFVDKLVESIVMEGGLEDLAGMGIIREKRGNLGDLVEG